MARDGAASGARRGRGRLRRPGSGSSFTPRVRFDNLDRRFPIVMMSNALTAYRRTRWLVAAIWVVYPLIGVATQWAPARWFPHRELYPFYSWSLFALVPNMEHRYTARIYEANGEIMEPPTLFEEARRNVRQPHSAAVLQLFTRLARAHEAGQEAEVERLLRLVDDHIPRPARFELVRLTYQPVERWRNGTQEETPIRMFTREKRP
jgi:hypothetical protein